MHEIAAGPPAHEYGSEVHPHVIFDSLVVRACIGTEGAVGVIGLDRGGNSIHDVGFSGGNPSHGRWAYYMCSPMFCSFLYSEWSEAMVLPSQSISTRTASSGVHLLLLGMPCTIGKVALVI